MYFALLYDPHLGAERRETVERVLPRTYLSSVVLAEILQGARGDLARARLRTVFRPLERTGRTVAPIHADWAAAGVAQGRLWDRTTALRSKSFLLDAVLAASARRIGATVVTENVDDFDRLRQHLPHEAMTLAELTSRVR